MSKAFIKFSSITHARLAQETLMRYNINSNVSRVGSPSGCAYALYPSCDANKAYGILNREGIKNAVIYRNDAP